MQQTSLEAYYFDVVPNIGAKQQEILNVIKTIQPCTDKQISKHLGYEINRITGRRNELADKGLIVENGIVKNEFNRNVMSWKPKS